MQRVEHALSFIDDSTFRFEPMHNVVHVDEKWFYADRNRRSYLVFDGEDLPPRAWKSKRFIPKTMFLAALARPRFDPHRKQRWNGKVGIWSFTEMYEAKRRSKNRAKGTLCTRNIDTVCREVYKDYFLTKVFPRNTVYMLCKSICPGDKFSVATKPLDLSY
ncbi:hypothetical protein PI125_g3611 [Phytophthora idaei]|nr:hypothetical protein PI125_g3611 [Phytophthora idaei]